MKTIILNCYTIGVLTITRLDYTATPKSPHPRPLLLLSLNYTQTILSIMKNCGYTGSTLREWERGRGCTGVFCPAIKRYLSDNFFFHYCTYNLCKIVEPLNNALMFIVMRFNAKLFLRCQNLAS